MKQYILVFALFFLTTIGLAADSNTPILAPAQSAIKKQKSKITYVIPIHGMIERGLVYVIRRGVAQAVKENADVIIFNMDTHQAGVWTRRKKLSE